MPAAGSAANMYIAQSAVGAADGADCNDAYAYTFFNTASNWGSGSAQIGPGTTVHLCGTITVPLNNSGLIVQGSGTSSSPITIFFEPNAVLQSPAFNGSVDGPGSAAFTPGGGIEINGYNYIIVDGGTNGIIQNTLNGTSGMTCLGGPCSYQQWSLGVEDSGDYNIIRNLTIRDIYMNGGSSSSATDTNGDASGDLYVHSVNFMQVCNNYLGQAEIGAEINNEGSSMTPTWPLPACSNNTFTSGINVFFGNTTYDHGWQIHANGTGAPSFYGNDISYWTDWFYPSSTYHQDGLFFFGASASTYFPQVFNNYFHGDIGGGSPTAMLYLAETDLNDGSGQSANVFNNVFYGTGGTVTCCGLISTDQYYSNPKGPYGFYNNTIVNSTYLFQQYLSQTSPTITFKNNIFYAPSGSSFYLNQDADGYTFSTATFQTNDYYGGKLSGNGSQAFGIWAPNVSFATWKSGCVSGGGTGCDSSSVTTDPTLAGESSFASGGTLTTAGFRLQAGSPAIGLGTNLTSLCSSIPALCYDAAGNQGQQLAHGTLEPTSTWIRLRLQLRRPSFPPSRTRMSPRNLSSQSVLPST